MARPRTHDDAVRRRLLERASEAISTGGPASLSVRAVATAAATTTAAVYSLFGSREALVQEVVAEGFRRFADHLAGAPRSTDPRADLLALGVAYRTSALANPHFYRVMFAPPSRVSGEVGAAGARAPSQAGGSAGIPGPGQTDGPARLDDLAPVSAPAPVDAPGRADGATSSPTVARPTFLVLRDAVARAMPDADGAAAEETALRLWSLAHGLVSLELAGLLPGTPAQLEARYVGALRSMQI